MTRYKVTGLDKGRKRSLIWLGGEIIGEDDLKDRFLDSFNSFDHEQYRRTLDKERRKDWVSHLTVEVLTNMFDEVLDFECGNVSTPEELQARADSWNSNSDRHYTIEDMKQMEEMENWNQHHGPPFSWAEIETALEKQPKLEGQTAREKPKCLECLQPMEWIWFSSSPETWRLMCGCAGWTAICRKCKTWRACNVEILS